MNHKSVKFSRIINYIKLLCFAGSIFFFAACDPLEPATESLYTVKFDLNGVQGATPDTQIIHEGEFAEHPYVDVDDRGSHGKFAAIEWYQNKDGSGPAFQFASTPIAASFWLYAKWTNNFQTVTFEPNYTGAKPFFRHVGTGKAVERPFDAIRTNYMFDGWHKADTSRFDFTNAINDDIVLYAHWVRAAYTVKFDLNGAQGTAPPDQIIAIAQQNQSPAIEPTAVPTRAGFTFIGWLSDKVDSVAFDFANTPISSDITLYAGWQSVYAFGFKGREYAAVMDGDTFLLHVGKTYTQINNQKVRLLRVPLGVTTKPAEGSEIQLSKSWGSFEANENGRQVHYKVKVFLEPSTKAELQDIVNSAIATEGNNVDLNFTETHQITDMSKIFFKAVDFNGNISKWDTSNVTNMTGMFEQALVFDGDISKWDTSNVTNMDYMFFYAFAFSGDISKWNTLNVASMDHMFESAKAFNADISKWNTSNVTSMIAMFFNAIVFNADISKWNTSKVTDMGSMFGDALVFNADISEWNTSKVTRMGGMFESAKAFNADISKWNTSNVKYMDRIFGNAIVFNADISKWNTSKVTDMRRIFHNAIAFNADISKWNTSNATTMAEMFDGAEIFNVDISEWNTSKVTDMAGMFEGAEIFNADISKWNTSKVTNMSKMFKGTTKFNQDISNWNTSNVTDMEAMFEHTAKFNQDISKWDTSKVRNMQRMFRATDKFYQDISNWNIDKVNKYRYSQFISPTSKLWTHWNNIPRKFRDVKHRF